MTEGLRRLQRYFHLPVSGEVDFKTLDLIGKSRCGNQDLEDISTDAKRTIHRKWGISTVKWAIYNKYPDGFPNIVERAFGIWAKHIDLKFQSSFTDVNILIGFKGYNHTCIRNVGSMCGSTFKNGILAHAYYPYINGRNVEIHINADLEFDLSNSTVDGKYNLFLVMVHEIGHSLGLTHRVELDSIMHPNYGHMRIEDFKLNSSDIAAMQAIYGRPKLYTSSTVSSHVTSSYRSTTSRPTTKPAVQPSIFMYVFYKQWVWLMDLKSKRPKQPNPIDINDWLPTLRNVFRAVDYSYKVSISPIGDLILIMENSIYRIDFKSMNVRSVWPFTSTELGFNNFTRVNGIVTSNYGLPYIFFDDMYAIQVDFNYFRKERVIVSMGELFPGIPTSFNGVYKGSDGIFNFFVGDRILQYDEYLKEVVVTSHKNLSILGITCPYITILDQLKSLLSTIISTNLSIPVNY
ncbi:matrix metalloproteinase-18-like [Onthophagus taurus]|uniref:matrix metalloproteinase-18-like n=1 Tax=Onthophagus taurus TaxID=166361 RepID=UPI0039BDE19D